MDIKAGDAIPETYLEWFRADLRHANEWREEAKLDFAFRDGHQWSEREMAQLSDQGRFPNTFNRIGSIVDAVSGQEISNRQEVRFIPRVSGPPEAGGDNLASELLTSAALWFRDRADADENDSEAFRDTITGGMGWTETRLSYEDNPDGDLIDDRLDPFEMIWDHAARKQNLVDANRLWRVRQVDADEAMAFAEGLGVKGATPEDLHAEWAQDGVYDWQSSGPHGSNPVRDRTRGVRASDGRLTQVVIVHCQWVERETVVRLKSPVDGETKTLGMDEWEKLKAAADPAMLPMLEQMAVRQKQKRRYQAILGSKVLKVLPTACPKHFNFKCITGKRDQSKGQFFGLVRAMRDPQSWSNKLYSQILHIINASAKGGIMAERGAFDDDREAEDSWARVDRITFMRQGALSGNAPKITPKPVAQVPPALQYLLDIASTSTYQVSGVNLELLGQREASQAGVLEYQRRQAGMTILQPYFDALKSYRREQGELILWYVQNDLSDGRLIRIVGKEEGRYVPLLRQPDQASLEYDIIVDDAPTAPNQKEKTWQLITQMLPIIKDMITPDVMLALAEDSPLPSSTIRKLQKVREEASKSPMVEMQRKMKELEAMVLETKAKLQDAQAMEAQAKAQAAMMEASAPQEDPNAAIQARMAEVQGKLAIKSAETQGNMAMQQQRASAEMAMQDDRQRADAEMQRQATMAKMALNAQESASRMHLKRIEAAHSMQVKAAQAKAQAANKPRPRPNGGNRRGR